MDRNAFHKLLAFGIERGVSDIHFEVGYPPHYRLHRELLGAIKVPPLAAPDTESIARMILEDRNITVDFTRRFAEIDPEEFYVFTETRPNTVILAPGQRASHIPEDTQGVPLEMRVKGFLVADATLGDQVEIVTVTGRRLGGTLAQVNPSYAHGFGAPIPELQRIASEVRAQLRES